MKTWQEFIMESRPCYWHEDLMCKNGRYCMGCEYQPPDEEKENGLKPPVELVDSFVCPSCGKEPYSGERCIFCGQRFLLKKWTEAEGDFPKLEGATREGEKVICDRCGTDLSVEGTATFVSHFDGIDTFGYTFSCNTCGKQVRIIRKRKEGLL